MYKALAKKRRDEGFTLVELLITIVIIGILAAVVVLAVGGLTGSGSTAACKATADAANTAKTSYYSNNNATWPTSFTQLVPTYLQLRGGVTVAANGASVSNGSNWTLNFVGGAAEMTCP